MTGSGVSKWLFNGAPWLLGGGAPPPCIPRNTHLSSSSVVFIRRDATQGRCFFVAFCYLPYQACNSVSSIHVFLLTRAEVAINPTVGLQCTAVDAVLVYVMKMSCSFYPFFLGPYCTLQKICSDASLQTGPTQTQNSLIYSPIIQTKIKGTGDKRQCFHN